MAVANWVTVFSSTFRAEELVPELLVAGRKPAGLIRSGERPLARRLYLSHIPHRRYDSRSRSGPIDFTRPVGVGRRLATGPIQVPTSSRKHLRIEFE